MIPSDDTPAELQEQSGGDRLSPTTNAGFIASMCLKLWAARACASPPPTEEQIQQLLDAPGVLAFAASDGVCVLVPSVMDSSLHSLLLVLDDPGTAVRRIREIVDIAFSATAAMVLRLPLDKGDAVLRSWLPLLGFAIASEDADQICWQITAERYSSLWQRARQRKSRGLMGEILQGAVARIAPAYPAESLTHIARSGGRVVH